MAFLMKIADLQKSINQTLSIADEAKLLFKKEGIGQKDLNDLIEKVSNDIKQSKEGIAKFLKDKQSIIEEVEFLTEAFCLEYGTILHYKMYSALIENKTVADHLARFGQMEKKHANELIKLIYKMGGTPKYLFKEKKPKKEFEKSNIMKALVEDEKKTIAFYEEGLSKFRDAEFAWLIGNLKLEEVEHLKELEKIEKEFRDKEICVRNDPDFKWVDPYMGDPGDRAWIE